MSRGLYYSLVTILTTDGDLSGFNDLTSAALGQPRPSGWQADGHHLPQCRHGISNASELSEIETTKVIRCSHRSLWCCFLLLIPIFIPVLFYIKDNDVTRRVFFGFFAVVLVSLIVCFSLVFFHSRARLVAARHNEERNTCADVPMSSQIDAAVISENSSSTSAGLQLHTSNYCQCQMTPRGISVNSHSPLTSFETPGLSNSNGPIVVAASIRDNLHLPLTTFKDNPPPYHVAVNLPSPNSLETPPPPYEHASQ